jgi:hypothetical protein
MLRHYCIYTSQLSVAVLQDLQLYSAANIEHHLGRTRFWLDIETSPAHALFILKYSTLIHNIDHETDHALGQ